MLGPPPMRVYLRRQDLVGIWTWDQKRSYIEATWPGWEGPRQGTDAREMSCSEPMGLAMGATSGKGLLSGQRRPREGGFAKGSV